MRKPISPQPTALEIADRIAYCPDTGEFTRLKGTNVHPAGSKAATFEDPQGYRVITHFGRRLLAHRVAWLLVHGYWPAGVIDHINGDRSDNRISNLRDVTQSVNLQNRRVAQANNRSSGRLGVTWHKQAGKWQAQIKADGRVKYLGLFNDQDAAQAAYLLAKRSMHQGCTI